MNTTTVHDPRQLAEQLAQRRANETGQAFGVWEHVGCYGAPSGDIPARHVFAARSFARPNPGDDWALVTCVDPEGASHV